MYNEWWGFDYRDHNEPVSGTEIQPWLKNNPENGNYSSENENPSPEISDRSNELSSISPDDIANLHFWWYIPEYTKNENLISTLNNYSEWNDSIEWLLAQNREVQLLLSEIIYDYKNYIWTDKDQLRAMIQNENLHINEDQSKMIESIYQYMLDNDSMQGFENFIINNGISIIKDYLATHIDHWGFKYLSKNEIKVRLKTGRFMDLYKWYKEKHTESSDALSRLESELTELNNVSSYVKNKIDNDIHKFLDKEIWENELVQNLENFLQNAKSSEKLKDFMQDKNKDGIIWLIRNSLKEYARLINISEKVPRLVRTGDDVFDMQLRSYLYLYWRITQPEKFTQDKWLNDVELWEILKAILTVDWQIKDDWKNKYVATERAQQRAKLEYDIQKRKETRARINEVQSRGPIFEQQRITTNMESSSVDIQHASWVEIAQDKWLWSQIIGFDRRAINPEIQNLNLQRGALMAAWAEFVRENQNVLSNYVNLQGISRFFIIWNNSVNFNFNEWENFKSKWSIDHPDSDTSELNEVERVLQSFPHKYNEKLRRGWEFINEKMDQAHETVKDYAIGAIIDNVKDMFQNIINTNNTWNYMSWFEFDWKDSAKIENNCLFLSWKFNWEVLNIKYDLNTWKIYMNSFVNESPTKIVIWGTNPEYEVWELKNFGDILDDFYKSPTESMNNSVFSNIRAPSTPRGNNWLQRGEQQESSTPQPQIRNRMSEIRDRIKKEHKIKFQRMCWTKLDEIGWNIKYQVETKNTQNSTVSNLMKTLHIDTTSKSIDLDKNTDLYNTIQIICNSNAETINNFSLYMQKLTPYLWLNWWSFSDHQDKNNEFSKKIFDWNNNDNEGDSMISYVRAKSWNYDEEIRKFDKDTQHFDAQNNFWILDIIKDKFITWWEPEWKLSNEKIKEFDEKLFWEIEFNDKINDSEQFEENEWEENISESNPTDFSDSQASKSDEDLARDQADEYLDQALLSA